MHHNAYPRPRQAPSEASVVCALEAWRLRRKVANGREAGLQGWPGESLVSVQSGLPIFSRELCISTQGGHSAALKVSPRRRIQRVRKVTGREVGTRVKCTGHRGNGLLGMNRANISVTTPPSLSGGRENRKPTCLAHTCVTTITAFLYILGQHSL